jgi:hypothetical protein
MSKKFPVLLILMFAGIVTAHSSSFAEEPVPWYENEQNVPYPDNTKALQDSTDNSVDILHRSSDDKALALQGEIMLKMREDIAEIYSNGNLVEQIVKGVGSTGVVTSIETDALRFTPTGRPELTCPSKDTIWFGPCRVEQNSEET